MSSKVSPQSSLKESASKSSTQKPLRQKGALWTLAALGFTLAGLLGYEAITPAPSISTSIKPSLVILERDDDTAIATLLQSVGDVRSTTEKRQQIHHLQAVLQQTDHQLGKLRVQMLVEGALQDHAKVIAIKQKLTAAEAANSILTTQKEQLEGTLSQLQTELQQHKQQYADLSNAKTALETEYLQLEAKLQQYEHTKTELKRQLEALHSELGSVQHKQHSEAAVANKMAEHIADLENQLAQHEHLTVQLDNTLHSNTILKADASRITQQLEALSQLHENDKNAFVQQQQILEKTNVDLKNSQHQLLSLQAHIKAASHSEKRLQYLLQQRHRAITALKSQLGLYENIVNNHISSKQAVEHLPLHDPLFTNIAQHKRQQPNSSSAENPAALFWHSADYTTQLKLHAKIAAIEQKLTLAELTQYSDLQLTELTRIANELDLLISNTPEEKLSSDDSLWMLTTDHKPSVDDDLLLSYLTDSELKPTGDLLTDLGNFEMEKQLAPLQTYPTAQQPNARPSSTDTDELNSLLNSRKHKTDPRYDNDGERHAYWQDEEQDAENDIDEDDDEDNWEDEDEEDWGDDWDDGDDDSEYDEEDIDMDDDWEDDDDDWDDGDMDYEDEDEDIEEEDAASDDEQDE
jgi:myosin heavy subunit